MTTTKSTTRGTIDAEVTVAYLQHVGGCTTTGTVSSTVPAPAIIRDQATATSAEGVILTLTLGQRRGVVDIWSANLCVCGCGNGQCRQNCM